MVTGHSFQHRGRAVTGAGHLSARPVRIVALGMLVIALLAACSSAPERVTGGPSGTYLVPSGIHKIKHVIIVMQENRSFDSYFGTYPATGAPRHPRHRPLPAACARRSARPPGGC
jgi:phospholipase C